MRHGVIILNPMGREAGMQWQHTTSSWLKKCKSIQHKVMLTVLSDIKGLYFWTSHHILTQAMQPLPSNTSKPVYQDKEQMSGKLTDSINLPHDYVHVAHRLQESGLNECHAMRGAWQPAYSPDFWPCDLWAVDNHRPYIHAGRLYVKVVVQGFRRQLKEFFADGIHWLVHQWESCLIPVVIF